MSNLPKSDRPRMYCRACSYILDGLESSRCPECGLIFDADDKRTYRRRPRWFWFRVMRRWALRGVIALALLAMAAGIGWLWLYRAHEQDKQAIAAVKAAGGSVGRDTIAPQWCRRWVVRSLGMGFPTFGGRGLGRIGFGGSGGITIGWDIQDGIYGPRPLAKFVSDHVLVHCERGTAVSFWKKEISDGDLIPVESLKRLNTLNIGYTRVEGDGLRHISGLKHLETLDLRGLPITDEHGVHLRSLTSLKRLELRATRIGDAGLRHLEGLTQLEYLDLGETRITDAGLQHLAGMTQLKELYLSETNLTDEGIAHLAGLTELTRLSLYEVPITDAGMMHLKDLSKLTLLDCQESRVTAIGVQALWDAIPGIQIVNPVMNPRPAAEAKAR